MRLIITDLDNTLYDWVTYFASAFTAMVDVLVEILQVEREVLLDNFKQVHQSLGDSEVPYAALLLNCVRERFPDASAVEIANNLQPAFEAFSRQREQSLKLYDGVRDTLSSLSKNALIVGHTEALVENANYRLQKLGILPFFGRVYALSRPIPPHPFQTQPLHFQISSAFVRVPPNERKPNPRLLADICAAEHIKIQDALYIGDSLTRDMAMARAAGVTAVWAKYGTMYNRASWDTLVRVTHWTDEDVVREGQLRERAKGITPDHILESFPEILAITSRTND